MTIRAPKGTLDVLPPESGRWRRLLRAFDGLAARYGYGLALTPLFEATELFARGVGEETDIVEKQMYSFTDKGDRSLTLRPEATASVVRAYLQAGRTGVLKCAYSGPMFRYEQPQAGRRRQFYQVGVEYLGEPSADADVEVIEVGYRLLEEAGVGGVTVLLNSLGDPADRAEYRRILTSFLEARAHRLSPDSQRRLVTNPLRVLDSRADAAVVADAPATLDHLGTGAAAHFAVVRAGLTQRSIPYEIAPRLVRGLDYYDRTVFEYQARSYTAAQDALGGGGRYDPLAELLGGPPTPGVGLAMGVDRIVAAMPEESGEEDLDVFVVVADPGRRGDALNLVAALRAAGLRADLDLGSRSVRGQFKAADRRGSRVAVVVGEEWDGGRVTVRAMTGGDEESIPIAEVEAWVRAR
ncbi:MAG TPA: histidine--tRNA ligase [Acidimicrobiia bacterium]|nr:histidine--tRNA ligase [Acidimicrobiia bacterium]